MKLSGAPAVSDASLQSCSSSGLWMACLHSTRQLNFSMNRSPKVCCNCHHTACSAVSSVIPLQEVIFCALEELSSPTAAVPAEQGKHVDSATASNGPIGAEQHDIQISLCSGDRAFLEAPHDSKLPARPAECKNEAPANARAPPFSQALPVLAVLSGTACEKLPKVIIDEISDKREVS